MLPVPFPNFHPQLTIGLENWQHFQILTPKSLFSTAPTARRLISTFECIARSVGFPLRPGHVAYGDGRNASAYPPDRAMHFINITTIFIVRQICGSERRLRRCRREERATSPGIGVMPTAYLAHINVVLSRRSFSCSNRILGQISGSDPAKPNKIAGAVGSGTIFSKNNLDAVITDTYNILSRN
jgi:hypothetical protein